MISNNRFFRIAMLFAITEIAKITIAPTVYNGSGRVTSVPYRAARKECKWMSDY